MNAEEGKEGWLLATGEVKGEKKDENHAKKNGKWEGKIWERRKTDRDDGDRRKVERETVFE